MKISIPQLAMYSTVLILLLLPQTDLLGQRVIETTRYQTASAMIRIDAIVVELDRKLGVDFDVAVDDVKSVRQSSGAITIIAKKTQDSLIKSLLDSKAGEVISSPQITTRSGVSATVQVGQEVRLPAGGIAPAGGIGPAVDRHVGLRLQCRPTLTGDTLRMEVECEYSRLSDQGSPDVRNLETAIELRSGETLMLSGVGDNGLIIFITPQVLPTVRQQSDPGHAPSSQSRVKAHPSAPVPTPDQPSETSRQVARIQDVFRSIDGSTLISIEVDSDEIAVTASIDKHAEAKIPEVLRKLAEGQSLRIARVSAKTRRDGLQIEIRCDPGIDDQPKPHNDSLGEMQRVMRELFPEEHFEIIQLPQSVVLRGNVSEKALPRIVRIAEDYFPSVISHLEPPHVGANTAPADDSSIGKQLGSLREDVRSLHADVKKLIQMMEAKPADAARNARKPAPKTVRQSARPDAADFVPWKVTLPEVISIVESHYADADPAEVRQRVNMSRDLFDQLRSLEKHRATLSALAEGIYTTSPPMSGWLDFDGHNALLPRIVQAEKMLRAHMGLPASDGRRITPVEE